MDLIQRLPRILTCLQMDGDDICAAGSEFLHIPDRLSDHEVHVQHLVREAFYR